VGSLHEVNPSPWVADGEATRFPPLRDDVRTDVVVIGAGITGLTLARMLVEDGAAVVVLDSGPVCAGVTGYTTAKVTALHRLVYRELIERHGHERTRAYADANQSAVRTIADFARTDDIECDLSAAAAVTYTERDETVRAIEAEAEACRKLGIPVELTTTTELPYPVKAAVRLDDQLHFHPRRYCLGLARRIASMDGAVHEHTRALQATTESSGVSVTTDRGTITADFAVLATHLPFLDRGGFFARAHPYRSYAMSMRVRRDRPDAMYISAEDPTRSLRPLIGNLLIVGGEGHKTGRDPDTTRRYTALEAWARSRFDIEAVEQRWSAQDYMTVDGIPYVGRLQRNEERVLVATGFRKWGMTNGTAAARILADSILGRENAWGHAFDATRLAPRPSLMSFLRENFDVARRFVGDRFARPRARTGEALAAGQAGIVDHESGRMACYRDEDGSMHAVSPTCTHLGCEVTFNTAERTWDCPCHGSRFDIDGRVLEGPAVRDLDSRTSAATGSKADRPGQL
jgi:glycine/D-amino acid oxidase-like deaminating enzyme/nitrite reductase/ring-hydroxylating ferredoxin subunit